LDKLNEIFAENETLTATIIQGGNMNYAFCVKGSDSNRTVFLKQAPEFVAIFGPGGFPLTSERMQKEMDVYHEWKTVLGEPKASTYLPTIYFFDESYMTVCMEFLDGFELLDHILVDADVEAKYNPNVATGLGDFMGRIHARTHSSVVEARRRERLVREFENRAMRDVQLEFVFTKCYREATEEQRSGLYLSEDFMKEVELMKQQYDGKTDSLVLCHGDLHPGSVMVDSSGQVKIIDPEFTVYGPPGLDVGSLLSGYCLGAVHQAFVNDEEAVDMIVESVQALWNAYVKALKECGITDDALIKSIEVETVGFAVAEVCRTALEFAGGRKWLQFKDADKKAAARRAALELVNNCMVARHTGGMGLLTKELKAVASKPKTIPSIAVERMMSQAVSVNSDM
jgi:5-methylthioribose kinase